MNNYVQHFVSLITPRKDPAPAEPALDKWARLDRWLALGAAGGALRASERQLTRDDAKTIAECLGEDGLRAVARVVAMSRPGRAPKNDAAIFALAMAAGDADPETRRAALAAVPRVCREGADLFRFVREVEGFRTWGRSLRDAIAAWRDDEELPRG